MSWKVEERLGKPTTKLLEEDIETPKIITAEKTSDESDVLVNNLECCCVDDDDDDESAIVLCFYVFLSVEVDVHNDDAPTSPIDKAKKTKKSKRKNQTKKEKKKEKRKKY